MTMKIGFLLRPQPWMEELSLKKNLAAFTFTINNENNKIEIVVVKKMAKKKTMHAQFCLEMCFLSIFKSCFLF